MTYPASLYSLGGYVFTVEDAPQHDQPAEIGRVVKWKKIYHDPVGALGAGATIRTTTGQTSPKITLKSARMTPAAVAAVQAFYVAESTIVFTSPWDTVGFNVEVDDFIPKVIRGYVPQTLERWEAEIVLLRRT